MYECTDRRGVAKIGDVVTDWYGVLWKVVGITPRIYTKEYVEQYGMIEDKIGKPRDSLLEVKFLANSMGIPASELYGEEIKKTEFIDEFRFRITTKDDLQKQIEIQTAIWDRIRLVLQKEGRQDGE